MLSPSDFREIVSGERSGLASSLLRGMLWLAEGPYSLAMRARNWLFDRGTFEARKVDAPVISVGNMTLGGTGKTPLVAWIAGWFRARGIRVTIVSRGYAAEQGGVNDEFRELEQRLPDVPHLQDADRHAAATIAAEELAAQVILLDDAFQHRQMHRDLDLVLLDATSPFGYDHVFPRGTLREPLAGLARADLVLLTRSDMLDPPAREAIRETVRQYAPEAGWIETAAAPTTWLNSRGETQPLDSLRGQRVAAFCGIGNPAGFRHTLAAAGCEVADFREFPDHHGYSRADIDSLSGWAASLAGVTAIVCTHKDLVKLELATCGGVPLSAAMIEIQFLVGETLLVAALEALAAKIPPDEDMEP